MTISHLLTHPCKNMEASLVREVLHYSQQPDILSLAGGLPDERFMPAYPDLNALVDSRQYGASEGENSLRDHVVSIVAGRGLTTAADNVLITNGSQQGLDIVSRLILDSDSTILTEQPTYLAACQVFKLQGAKVQDVVSDAQGMSLEALREAIDLYNPKAVYLIPNFQNPAGHCYSIQRRKEIAALLDEKNVLLIEDDPYRELCYEEVDLTPISSLVKTAPWLYMGSFSKVLWPGLRTGYVVSCAVFTSYLIKVKQASDLHTNRLGQAMISHFLSSGAYPAHVAKLQEAYRQKRDAMMAALNTHLGDLVEFTVPSGGMFFWVKLPSGLSSKLILEEALKEKVLVLPGIPFFPCKSPLEDSFLRLSFARVSPDDINKAVAVLAKVIKRLIV
ncbi:PLP-dependent aminotransferase family protein [Marinomonas transparens]|uniref:PLP-dependent aminotransferase family protein n=1 Tax=Marinomonas transparens TaxID=2795388 RepID=A0A934MWS7_9GAMM|nr:PLP-dependent aminotransferase family protein [Marinomonas transparens]MBJ7538509.1 PLP-dependent aminotransferase family protein [Marinomonas transparens]